MNCIMHQQLLLYNFYFIIILFYFIELCIFHHQLSFMGCTSEHMHVWVEHIQPQKVVNDLFTHTSVSDLVD